MGPPLKQALNRSKTKKCVLFDFVSLTKQRPSLSHPEPRAKKPLSLTAGERAWEIGGQSTLGLAEDRCALGIGQEGVEAGEEQAKHRHLQRNGECEG